MRTGKNGLRRITAMVCALALCASMLPTAVFATEPADVADAPVAAVTQPVEDEQQEVVETPVQDETDSTPAPETDETKAETTTPAEPAEDTEQPAEGEGTTESVEEPVFAEEPVEEVPAEEVQPLGESAQLDSKPAAASNVIGGTTKKSAKEIFSVEYYEGTSLDLKTDLTVIALDAEGNEIDKAELGAVYSSGWTMTIQLNEAYADVYELRSVSGSDGVSVSEWTSDFNDAYSTTFTWSDWGRDSGTIYLHVDEASHVLKLQSDDKSIDLGTITWKEGGKQLTTIKAYLNYELVYTSEPLNISNALNNFNLDLNEGYYFDTTAKENIHYSSDIDGQTFTYAAPYNKLSFGLVPSIFDGNNTVELYFFNYDDGVRIKFDRYVNNGVINVDQACPDLGIKYSVAGVETDITYTDLDSRIYLPRNAEITVTANMQDGYYFQYWHTADAVIDKIKLYTIGADGNQIIQYTGPLSGQVGQVAFSESMVMKYDAAFLDGLVNIYMTDGQRPVIDVDWTVTYCPNGENVVPATEQVQYFYRSSKGTYGTVIRGCMFTRDGYEFLGWNTKPDGTGTAYTPDAVYGSENGENDLTLYAQWKKIDEPTIPDPTPEDLNKLGEIINIACTNNSSHEPITSAVRGGNDKDYVITHEANSEKATVTILNTDPYVKSYKQGDGQGKDHTLDAGSDLELGLVYVNGAWALDASNSATVYVTCAPIVITPADLVIYKGGEQGTGSSNVNIVDGNGKTLTNNGSLPEMGFYLQLSDELNQQLSGASDAETQDLSKYITLSAKDQDGNELSWKLEKYGDGTSVASDDNGYFIYKIVPAESGTGAKLNVTFQDSEGVYVDTDAFTLTNSLSEEYSMRIYGDRVDAGTLKAEITISGQPTFTVGVVGAEDPATLTVRYVNGDQIDVVTHSYDSIEAASEADDPKQKALHTAYMIREDSNKFVINESNVQVDGKDVSLLFDDIVDSTSYEYEKTLTSKAVAAAINADGSLNGVTLKTEAKYLDLVESGNGNAWVTAQNVNGDPQAVKVYWPYPEGTDKYTKFYLAHFEDLDRDTSTAAMAEKLSSAKATGMSIQKDDYGISFTTTDFSPYVLVWEESQGQVTPPDNGDGNNNTTTNNNTQNTTVNVAANNSAAAPAAAAVAIPQTGDNSQPLVWIALVGISGAALAALAVFRRKRSDK